MAVSEISRAQGYGGSSREAAGQAQAQSPEIDEAARLISESAQLQKAGKFDEAIAPAARALEIYERLLGPEHGLVAVTLARLAVLYQANQDYTRAEPTYLRLLALREKTLGPDHPDLAHLLSLTAEACGNNGNHQKAEALFQRALSLREKAFGAESVEVFVSLVKLGNFYLLKDEYAKAEPLYLRALAIADELKLEGENVALLHNNLGELYRAQGKYPEAELNLKASLALCEKLPEAKAPHIASVLSTLASLYTDLGNYKEAERALRRALSIRENRYGPESLPVAETLSNLGHVYTESGAYTQAGSHLKRALAIKEKLLGPEHPSVATTVGILAGLYYAQADYRNAEQLYQRVLSIREKATGPESLVRAYAINNLAAVYEEKGDYVKAELLYQRALDIFEKRLGPDHPTTAVGLNNLAALYKAKGDYAKARALYERSYQIRLKSLGPDHPDVAASLNNLAMIYDRKTAAESEAMLQRALLIAEKARGQESTIYAALLNNLATVYSAEGRGGEAEALYRRVLTLRERLLGPSHGDVGSTLANLGVACGDNGDYACAEASLQRALLITEKVYGTEHPQYATALGNLSNMYMRKGDAARAIETLARANEIGERLIAFNLASGSERQKLSYLKTFSGEFYASVAFHMQHAPQDPAALRLALLTILRRKGRTLDEMTDTVGALRRRLDSGGLALIDGLTEARSRLATLVLKGPGPLTLAEHQARIKRAAEETETLGAEVSRRSAAFRLQSQPVTLEAVRAAIPPGAALVEIVAYHEANLRVKNQAPQRGADKYAAYVLLRDGQMFSVELGDAATINSIVTDLRAALRNSASDVRRPARALDEMVMRPVRRLLGGARHILISPDGALNLIPFAALVDEEEHYLLENYSFTYLGSGRDLLRLQARLPGKESALVIADPQFDDAPAPGVNVKADNPSAVVESRRSRAFKERFSPLEGTAAEARELGQLLPGTRVVTGSAAREATLKRLGGPLILHIATHGFFLEHQKAVETDDKEAASGAGVTDGLLQSLAETDENPLLRSGLAFTGANQLQGGDGEDGILTALEVASLDLWGTRLVVLSACETGLGEVQNGEGVYGLRRALVLAGAESALMSLWKVDDQITKDLMVAYYTGLLKGEGRGEALRRVQLLMLRDEVQRHPYFWASFIQSGDWRNLEGEEPPPDK